jgi:hypothetical protein
MAAMIGMMPTVMIGTGNLRRDEAEARDVGDPSWQGGPLICASAHR